MKLLTLLKIGFLGSLFVSNPIIAQSRVERIEIPSDRIPLNGEEIDIVSELQRSQPDNAPWDYFMHRIDVFGASNRAEGRYSFNNSETGAGFSFTIPVGNISNPEKLQKKTLNLGEYVSPVNWKFKIVKTPGSSVRIAKIAIYLILRNNGQPGPFPSYEDLECRSRNPINQEVRCYSESGQFISGAEANWMTGRCVENQSWGYREDYIWVKEGCVGEFKTFYY